MMTLVVVLVSRYTQTRIMKICKVLVRHLLQGILHRQVMFDHFRLNFSQSCSAAHCSKQACCLLIITVGWYPQTHQFATGSMKKMFRMPAVMLGVHTVIVVRPNHCINSICKQIRLNSLQARKTFHCIN